MEVLLRRQLMRGFYGWIAYTLSRSTRLDDPSLMTGGYHLYDFDQTHILTVIASYQTEHNWTFGTRLRYTSGDPYTPFVNGIFNANNASYECIAGNPDTARAPGFFQADVRIDRRFVYNNWSFTAVPRHPKRHQPRQPRGAVPELQLPGVRDFDRTADLPHARPEGRVLKRRPHLSRAGCSGRARSRSAWRRASPGSTATIRS